MLLSSRRRIPFAALLASAVAVAFIVSPVDAATKKRSTKRPAKPAFVPLPATTAPAPQPLPPSTAAVTAPPTTTAPAVAITIKSDFPRRLAVPGGSAVFVLTVATRSPETTTLSVSGLPAGVRAVLATNPIANTTTMTLTTTLGITPGGYQSFLVTAVGSTASATLPLELVVDTTVVSATTTVAPAVPVAFAPTSEALLPGPITAGGGNFVVYRVTLNRPVGVGGAATVTFPTLPAGIAGGLSESSVSGSSFIVSFSAAAGTASGFSNPTVNVVLGGYPVLISFPVRVT
jgi:hypothetical protein